jgi:hypothetical protein
MINQTIQINETYNNICNYLACDFRNTILVLGGCVALCFICAFILWYRHRKDNTIETIHYSPCGVETKREIKYIK